MVFILNALAIIPLAVIISTATESLASRLGDTSGALLNVTVGNAAELIIFFTALAKDQIRIVQASLLGSILANSLLVLGTANICGGLRYGHNLYDKASGRLSVCLLDIGLALALLPVSNTAESYASGYLADSHKVAIFASTHDSKPHKVKTTVLSLSRGISIGLICLYLLYLLLQMVLQTTATRSIAPGLANLNGNTYLSLQEQPPLSPIERVRFPKGTTGSWQRRSTRFRNLSLSIPGLSERSNGGTKWIPDLGIASIMKKIRHELLARTSDPHDNYYRLQDLSDDSVAPPKVGPIDALSPEQRKSDMSQLPFFPNVHANGRADTPLRSNGHIQSPISAEWTPSRPQSQVQSPVAAPQKLPHSSLPDPDCPIWTHIPPSEDRNEHAGRKSPSESEQSFKDQRSLPVATFMLLITTGIASVTTELAVDAIPELVDSWNISHVFLGFIVLPFVGNAAEHVTAAKMALRNRMVLAKNVAVESATQVLLFITPAIVLLGWMRGRRMTLQFDHFEIGCILLTGLVVSVAICRGESGWKQGLILHAIYLSVAVGAVFYRGHN